MAGIRIHRYTSTRRHRTVAGPPGRGDQRRPSRPPRPYRDPPDPPRKRHVPRRLALGVHRADAGRPRRTHHSRGRRRDVPHQGPARRLAEEWTYRYLAAAHAWASSERALAERIGGDAAKPATSMAPGAPEPATSEVRAWARVKGITVPDRGRLRPDIWQAWRDAQQP